MASFAAGWGVGAPRLPASALRRALRLRLRLQLHIGRAATAAAGVGPRTARRHAAGARAGTPAAVVMGFGVGAAGAFAACSADGGGAAPRSAPLASRWAQGILGLFSKGRPAPPAAEEAGTGAFEPYTRNDPFLWPELVDSLGLRANQQARAREFAGQQRVELLHSLRRVCEIFVPEEAAAAALYRGMKIYADFAYHRDQILWTVPQIMRGEATEPPTHAERAAYRTRYGPSAWTDAALAACAARGPLVEMGTGRWADALAAQGCNVVKCDLSKVRSPQSPAAKELSNHAGRALLLVFPTPEQADACFEHFGGSTLLFVGEGQGGQNGSDGFFDALRSGWRVEQRIELRPLPGSYERLFVMTRLPFAAGGDAEGEMMMGQWGPPLGGGVDVGGLMGRLGAPPGGGGG